MEKRHYHSQYNQDETVEKICNSSKNGVFVEIGAYDGVTISNTFYLEKILEWKGVIVEPIPSLSQQCQHNRWCDIWQGAISTKDGEANFLHIDGYSEMLSGIQGSHPEGLLSRLSHEIKTHHQSANVIKVNTLTLHSLFDKFKLKIVDYLSLDTQGSEYDVIKTLDIKKHPVKIISLDTNGNNTENILKWFDEQGYEVYFKHPRADEYIFVHPQIKYSWEL